MKPDGHRKLSESGHLIHDQFSRSCATYMAGRLSLGFAAAGLIRGHIPSPRVVVSASSCRVRVVSALRGTSSARRRFSEEWNNDVGSALYESIGDIDRAPQPLTPPSAEQQDVVKSVRSRVNVVVEAVAGSGKTTTVLHCAREVPKLKFLVLTYNARLKLTTRQRAKELGLGNVETHSFHACASRYYSPDCRNDESLRQVVDSNTKPHSKISFDCLVIDEAQDLTPLLHRFVLKILKDAKDAEADTRLNTHTNTPPTLLVLGDSRQSIYQFRDADPRFLTMADRGLYYVPNKMENGSTENDEKENSEIPTWRHHTLRTSFRATPRIASFVNDAMLGFECIKTVDRPPHLALPDGNRGAPVTYMVGNEFALAQTEIADEIEFLLNTKGYAPDDIFVLTPSLKGAKLNSKTPLAQLENTLVMSCKIPVYVSLADEEELSDSLTRGKICFTTFHSSKGLERPVVFAFGFSENYFTYFARDAPKEVCPNTLYVAATRASERLYVVGESEEGGKLPFLRLDPEKFDKWGVPTPDWLEVRRYGKLRPVSDTIPVPASSFAVTDLVKFLPEQVMRDAVEAVGATTVEHALVSAEVDASVPSLAGAGLIESVSDITGLAVVAVHEHRHESSSNVPENRYDSNSAHTTSLARRLQTSLQKMEKQLEQNAAQRSTRSDGNSNTRVDLIVDDVEAIRQMRGVLSTTPNHVRDFLKLAAWYEAMEGGYLFRPFQLSNFDWVTNEAAFEIARVLEKHLPTENLNNDVRPAPAKYEKRYDVSFRFGAAVVTIRGAADVVTAAGPTGELFEVKCVNRLLPEHLLQLALYQWLDAFGVLQRKINKARERKRQREGGSESDGSDSEGSSNTKRPHRGWKGSGKGKREYTEEESEDPVSLLEQFLAAGGDERKIMRRAVLLNSRTGEAVELRCDLNALTKVVLTLVDQRIRNKVAVSDKVFLQNAANAGAAIHEKATSNSDGGFVPTPAIEMVTGDTTNEKAETVETAPERKQGRGLVKVTEGKKDVDAASEESPSPSVSKETKAVSNKKKPVAPPGARSVSTSASSDISDFIIVNGVERACNMKRRVLTDGDQARPRGRAPKGSPFWDSVEGKFVAEDTKGL